MVDVVKLLRHWQAGDNVSRMARALGLDRKAAQVDAWFPELSDPRARSSVHGQIAPFHEYIEKHLGETTLATIHHPPSTSACATSRASP